MPNEPNEGPQRSHKPAPVLRAVVEVGFIVFLYYSNLLMGEYEGSGAGPRRGLMWALGDILTPSNLAIALASAGLGYLVIEFVRKRL